MSTGDDRMLLVCIVGVAIVVLVVGLGIKTVPAEKSVAPSTGKTYEVGCQEQVFSLYCNRIAAM